MSLEEKAKIVRYRQEHPHESSYRVADYFSIEFCKKVNARAVQRKSIPNFRKLFCPRHMAKEGVDFGTS